MLKKIKDLTEEEITRICRKRIDDNERCVGCPLSIDLWNCLDMFTVREVLNREIEVDDESARTNEN